MIINMNMNIRKKMLPVLLGLMVILILAFTINKSNILIFSAILLICILPCIIEAFFNRLYLYFLFEIFIAELYVVMVIRSVVLKASEESWRASYNIESMNLVSLKYLVISLSVIGIVQILGSTNIKKTKMIFPKVKTNNAMLTCFNIFSIIFLALFIVKSEVLSLRNYADTIDTTYIPIFIMILCTYLCMFWDLLTTKCKYRISEISTTLVIILYLLIFFVLVVKGYRFLLVQIGILLFLLYVQKKTKISYKTLVLIGFIGMCFYILLVFIKSRYLGLDQAKSLMFGHERNLFFSLNAIISKVSKLGSGDNTYISTLSNLLPKTITHSDHLNVSGIIMQYINPSSYTTTGVTVGAFYLTEAYLSFGVMGVLLVSIVIAAIILMIEKIRNKRNNSLFCYFYIFVGAQMFNVVYYGSLNYVKQIVYFVIMIKMLKFTKVIVFDYSHNKLISDKAME